MIGPAYILNPNGGWCWFQDERALIWNGRVVFGSVAGADGCGARAGDVRITAAPLDSLSAPRVVTLAGEFQSDDHDVPALLPLADGLLAAFYQTHGDRGTGLDPTLMRWRIADRPEHDSGWRAEQNLRVLGMISYSNPFVLPAEGGRIYNFFRVSRTVGDVGDNNPYYAVSDDGGASFRFGGRLLRWRIDPDDPKYTGLEGGRPYVQYASNGRDAIHFLTSEDHPRAYDNSLYHGFLRGGVLYGSGGDTLAPLSEDVEGGLDLRRLTRVFEGGPRDVAWPVDFRVDARGYPVALFSVQKDGAAVRNERAPETVPEDHRYALARWDGARWRHREIAFAGTGLYKGENDYTGLGALHPADLSQVVISTNADPTTGVPLVSSADGKRHHELFHGVDPGGDGGWTWRRLTRDSDRDQLRPVIPAPESGSGRTVLLWLAGDYRSWSDYSLRVMGAAWQSECAPRASGTDDKASG